MGARSCSRTFFAILALLSIAVALLASPVTASAQPTTVPVPTAAQLAAIQTTFDSFKRSGLIPDPELAAKLAKDLQLAAADLAAGTPAKAKADVQRFSDLLKDQLDLGNKPGDQAGPDQQPINQSAARTLIALANGAPPPSDFTVAPTATTPTVVATVVAATPVTVSVPPASPIASVKVVPPPPATVLPPPPPGGAPMSSLIVTAATASGAPVTTLTTPVPLSSTFTPPLGINGYSAVFSTFDPITGAPQPLATTIVKNSDGSFTATASTPHFSTFVVNAGRPTVTSVTPIYGPVAGGTTVQVGGFSLQAPTDVLFNGVSSAASVRYDLVNGVLTTVAPPGPVGPATIQVIAGGQTSDPVNAPQFTYYAPLRASAVFAPSTVYTGDAVIFNASSSGGYGPVTFAWTFSDGGTAAGGTASRTYPNLGTFTATVTATDSIGNVSPPVTVTVIVVLPTLAGTVTDGVTHAAVAGVSIEVDTFYQVPGDGVANLSAVATAITGSDGKYSVAVPNGFYKVHFLQTALYAPQWLGNFPRANGSPTQNVNGAPITGLDAAMAPGFRISGLVSLPAGGAASGVLVTAYLSGSCCVPVSAATTGADGLYSLTVPNPGSYVVGVDPPAGNLSQFFNGAADFSTATVISAAQTANVSLVAGDPISGRVSFGMGGLPYVNVMATTQGGASYFTQTDSAGNYTVTVPTGGPVAYKLQFNPLNAGATGSPAPAYLGGGANPYTSATAAHPSTGNNITLAAGFRVLGSLVPGLAGSRTQIWDVSQANQGGFGPLAAGFSDGSGNYSFLVPPGTYIVHLNPNLVQGFLQQWYLGAGGSAGATPITVSTADVQLSPATLVGGHYINGTVNGTGGVGLPGVNVNASTPPPAGGCCPNFVSGTQSGAGGAFSILVPNGTYILMANPPQTTTYLQQWYGGGLTPNGATQFVINGLDYPQTGQPAIVFQLATGNLIHGRITDTASPANGIANANIGINSLNPDGTCCGKGSFVTGGRTDGGGNYSVRVPAGKYQLMVNPPSPFLQTSAAADASAGDVAVNLALATGYVIQGRVLNNASQPVPQANINVNSAGCCAGFGTQTDGAGNFSIAVPAGTYLVSYQPPPGSPFTAQWYNGVSSADAATPITLPGFSTPITFTLTPGFTLSGQVTDQLNRGLGGVNVDVFVDRGATVGVCCGKGQPGVGGFVAHTVTDPSGNYSTIVPANGGYVVQFTNAPPGNLPAEALVTAGVNPTLLSIKLPAGTVLNGRVTGPGASGLGGMPVHAVQAGLCCMPRDAQTDPNGYYQLTVETNANWIVQFAPNPGSTLAPAWYNGTTFGTGAPTAATVINSGNPPAAISAQLQPGLLISGHVDGSDQLNLGGAGVSLIDPGAIDSCCWSNVEFTQTDPAGNFSFYAPAGNWLVQASGNGPQSNYLQAYYSSTGSVFDPHLATAVSGGPTSPSRQIILQRGVILTGTVRSGAAGIGGVNVYSGSARPDGSCCVAFFGGTMTGSGGTYSLLVPATGPIVVNFNPPPGFLQTRVLVNSPYPVVDVSLVAGSVISGSVTDSRIATGPNGVSGVGVSALDLGNGCCDGPFTQTDSAGNYSLTVPNGNWTLQFMPNSGTLAPQWWDGTAGGATSPVSAAPIPVTGSSVAGKNAGLVAGTIINGHVGGSGGVPDLRNVDVWITDPRTLDLGGYPAVGHTLTDGGGNYAVVVPAGNWLLQFAPDPNTAYIGQWYSTSAPGTNDPRQATPISGGAVARDAALVPGFRVSGKVTIAGSTITPAPGIARVNITANRLNADGTCCGVLVNGTQSAADGSYSFMLPTGSFQLNFNPPPGYFATTTTTMVASSPVSGVNAALTAGSILSGQVVSNATGLPVGRVSVQAYDSRTAQTSPSGPPGVQTDANGRYQLTVPNGSWVIQFRPPGSSALAPQWYTGSPPGAATVVGAAPVVVTGPDIPLVVTRLVGGTVISGSVRGSVNPAVNAYVTAADVSLPCCSPPAAATNTDVNGNYTLVVPNGANFKVSFYPQLQAIGFLPGSVTTSAPTNGSPVTLNGVLADAFMVSGNVTSGSPALPVQGVQVTAQQAPPAACCVVVGSGVTDSGGKYAFMVAAGSPPIVVEFNGLAVGKLDRWYLNSSTFAGATPLTVSGPLVVNQGV